MLDANVLIPIVPPILSAGFVYLVARKKSIIAERMNKAKIEAEIQTQALTIVRGAMNDMRDEFRREIEFLKKENGLLKEEIIENKTRIETLQHQLTISDGLISTLKSEISTLQSAIRLYQDENARLKQIR